MKATNKIKTHRCAIYTRKSHEEGLEQEFNSLDAQRESGEAYIKSQQHEQWKLLPTKYDDGGFSGGNLERPALKQLLTDIEQGKIDIIVVYKVDRLSRSLSDFAKLMELFDLHKVSFVSVTQQFNTTNSMGRLTLNMLLSFAQFEREVTSERIRDKLAASKKKGMWMGGTPPFGYEVKERRLIIIDKEATIIRDAYQVYLNGDTPLSISSKLNEQGIGTKRWISQRGNKRGGGKWTPKQIYRLLTNPIYYGKIKHKDKVYGGEHQAIINQDIWDKVQQAINKNNAEEKQQTEKRLSSGHPLKGLLRLDTGEAFSPSGTKGIRYYVSQKAIKQGYKNCELKSLNANMLEDIVLAYTLQALPKAIQQHILQHYRVSKQDAWLLLRKAIICITISTNHIWLKLCKAFIADLQAELAKQAFHASTTTDAGTNNYKGYNQRADINNQIYSPFNIIYPAETREDDTTITCKIAIQIKRHDGRRYILASDGKSIIQHNFDTSQTVQELSHQSNIILQAIVETHLWKDALTKDNMTVNEFAKHIHQRTNFIYKRLRLLNLSPTIVQHITTGTLPITTSLKDLHQASQHLSWDKQHQFLGL